MFIFFILNNLRVRSPTKYLIFIFSQNLLEELRNEKEKLLREVEEFETRTGELEQQLKESEEKLQLVVEFPSIDAKQRKTSQSDKEVMFNGGEVPSEADVAQDMERQVMSNNIRIMTLEEQNEKLRGSIAFLMNARDSISKNKVSLSGKLIIYFLEFKIFYKNQQIIFCFCTFNETGYKAQPRQPQRKCEKGQSQHSGPTTPELYPGFRNKKRLRVLLLSLDAMLVHRLLPTHPPTPLYFVRLP